MVKLVRTVWKKLLLYLIFAGIICFLFYRKNDYFVDELLTYNLANAESWFEPENGVTYSPASQPFLDALASNGTFDLIHIWKQQAEDTHPPFYYILVHAICTLFPNTLSVRYAGIINLVFQMLILYVVRKIVMLLFDNSKITYIMSIMYILNAGVLEISTFLRMYVMTMFWVVMFAYIILKNIKEFKIKHYIQLALVAICGALTHYYFIVFAFFLSAVIVIIMLSEKRAKESLLYFVSMAISGGVSCVIFPAMIKHIFTTGRGSESINNLESSDLLIQLEKYFEIINDDLFGGYLIIILSIICFVLLVNWLYTDQDDDGICVFGKIEIQRYLCLIIPVIFYVLVISKTAPYNVGRYVSPIYPILIIVIMGLLYKCISSFFNKEKNALGLFAIMIAIITSVNLSNCTWDNLYESSKARLNNAETYGPISSAICLYESSWKINVWYNEMSQFSTVTFYNTTDYDEFIENFNVDNFEDNIAFFLIDVDVDSFIERFIDDYPQYEVAVDNGSFQYGQSIYLGKK
jgi:hypothetical protein